MRRKMAVGVVPFFCAAVAAAFLSIVSAALAAPDESRWGANYFPNVTLTTQDGRTVHFYEDLLKGKIVAINLMYTTCKYACPLETARLAQVQALLGDRMGRDVFFYSITIDPEHDTPPVLKEYAEKFHAGPGWLFLTGKAEDIELISRKLGIYTEPNPANKDGHTPSLIVGNEATGQWMRNSALDNPKFLANTIGNWMNSWRTAKPGRSYAEAKPLALNQGQYAFTTHCAPCHSIGGGRKVGPDLAGVTKTRDREWLARFIVAPATMAAEGDPIAVELFEKYRPLQMPNLSISRGDAEAIIGYLEASVASTAAPGPSPAIPSVSPASATARGLSVSDLQPAIRPYLAIQRALASDTLDGVAEAAGAIAAAVRRADASEKSIVPPALALQRAANLAAAREAFGRLGDSLLAAAREGKLDVGRTKVAYCPMARKYWLQEGDEIRNPFYGRAMLECGRLVARIPATLR